VRVELLLDNADRRVPAGLLGSVAFGPATTTALVLPVNTLVIRDGQSMVAIVTEGKVRFAPVRLGRNLGSRVEILSGLTPDASVVLSPNALLREGDSVSVATSSTAQRG
jgi:multidrug efflux pump subunit AcrA (membrane-fusion protein)